MSEFGREPIRERGRIGMPGRDESKFMKPIWLLLFLVSASFNPLAAQEVKHAPSIAQCRADQRLWSAEAQGRQFNLISYMELVARADQMGQCSTVDPEFAFKYFDNLTAYSTESERRLQDFVMRHGLFAQFKAEDAHGKGR
jgi:hypothetical protein